MTAPTYGDCANFAPTSCRRKNGLVGARQHRRANIHRGMGRWRSAPMMAQGIFTSGARPHVGALRRRADERDTTTKKAPSHDYR
jgi:hypothetical protein